VKPQKKKGIGEENDNDADFSLLDFGLTENQIRN